MTVLPPSYEKGLSPPSPVPQRLSWLASAVIILIGLAFCVSIFLPAYVDDVLYLISDSRAGYDRWQSITAYPQCGPGFVAGIPFTLLPGRAWAWAIHYLIDDFYTLRVVSLTILVSWIIFTAWSLKRCILTSQPWLYIFAGIASFIALGAIPFALALGRPETSMIFAVSWYVFLPFIISRYPSPPLWVILTAVLLFFLVTSWFFSVHPKALFYAPLTLVSAGYVCKWHKAAGTALVMLTVITCYQAVHFIQTKMGCPDSDVIRQFQESVALSPSLFFANNMLFWKQLTFNLVNTVSYIWEITLPNYAFIDAVSHDSKGGYSLSLIIAMIFVAIIIGRTLLWTGAGIIITARMGIIRRDLICHPLPLLYCLLAAGLAQCITQTEKVFYNFSLIWVSFLFCGITTGAYLSQYAAGWDLYENKLRRGFKSLLLLSLVSQCAALATYIPATLTALHGEKPNGVIPMSFEASMGEQNYAETRAHILNSALTCHIAPDQSSQRVGVDRFTYLPLKNTYQPMQIGTRLLKEYNEPQKLLGFLRKEHSSGMVALCLSLPEQIRRITQEKDGMCCVSREQIDAQ